MFTKEFYIHTYEVDKNKRLTLPTLLNYFQDVMIDNVDSFGAGSEYHMAQNLFWVLIDYEIEVHELPIGKSFVTCGTVPYSFKRFYGYRKWEMKDSSGKLLAEAKGKFVLMNYVTKEITSPSPEIISLFTRALKEPYALDFTKIVSPKENIDFKTIDKVKNTYIDIYNHMNNVYYLLLAYNTIPHSLLDDHKIKKVRINYKKECVIDDELIIEGSRDDNKLNFEIKNNGNLLSSINFTIE